MRYYEVTAKCGHVGKKDKRGFLVFIGSVWYNHLKKNADCRTAEPKGGNSWIIERIG